MEKFAHFVVQFQASLYFRFRSLLSRDAFIHWVFSSYTWCSFKAGSSFTWCPFKAGSSYTWCSFKAGSFYTWCSFKAGFSYSWCSFKSGSYGLMSNASLHCENSIVNKNTEEFSRGKWQNTSGVHVVVEVGKAAISIFLSRCLHSLVRACMSPREAWRVHDVSLLSGVSGLSLNWLPFPVSSLALLSCPLFLLSFSAYCPYSWTFSAHSPIIMFR